MNDDGLHALKVLRTGRVVLHRVDGSVPTGVCREISHCCPHVQEDNEGDGWLLKPALVAKIVRMRLGLSTVSRSFRICQQTSLTVPLWRAGHESSARSRLHAESLYRLSAR